MAQHRIDIKRTATAKWTGDVPGGSGRIKSASGAVDVAYSFNTRFGSEPGTNPEELLAASHGACFTMALAFALTQAGHAPATVDTTATVPASRFPASICSRRRRYPASTTRRFSRSPKGRRRTAH